MYHIKNDKRSQTSAKLISEGLYECLKKKDFSDITITDVQRASGTGRATFYRLFDNLSDVLYYQCDKIFRDTINIYKENQNQTLDDYFAIFLNDWIKNEKILETIVKCNRYDILINVQYKNIDILKMFFEKLNLDETQYDYFISYVTAMIIGTLATWIKRGRKETPEELHKNVKESYKLFYSMIIEK